MLIILAIGILTRIAVIFHEKWFGLHQAWIYRQW